MIRARVHLFNFIQERMDQIENNLTDNERMDASKEEYPMNLLLSMAEEVREEIRTNVKIAKFLLHKRRVRAPEWLNSQEVLVLLKVSTRTLERYRQRNLIRFFVINGHCRYLNSDVMAMLDKKTA